MIKLAKHLSISGCPIMYLHMLIDTNHLLFSKAESLKKINEKHIQQAQSIKELLKGTDITRLTEQPIFRPFIHRVTELLIARSVDMESLECIKAFLHEIRRFSSAELHSNSSDIVNYQLLFKQLARLMPDTYKIEGFEYRATMVAQSLPKIASFEGCEPAAISLLHYMSSYSQISKGDLKKNLINYFVRYFLYQRYTAKQSGNSEADTIKSDPQSHMVDPNVGLILLSCSQARETKTTLCSTIDSITMLNINRKIHLYRKYYGLQQPLMFYIQKLKSKQLLTMSPQQKNELKQALSKIQYLAGIEDGGKVVVNTEEKLLQSADLFIRLISKQYINVVGSETSTNAILELVTYFYLIIAASDNMSIHVLRESPKNSYKDQKQIDDKKNDQKPMVIEVKLWKIVAQILKCFSHNKIFVHRKDDMAKLIINKLVQFIKKHVTIISGQEPVDESDQANTKVKVIVKAKSSLRKQIKGLESVFIKLFSYIPVDALRKYKENEPHLHELLSVVVKQCMKELPTQKQKADQLCTIFMEFIRLKKTLIVSKKELLFVFRSLIKQDKNYQLWKIYFFMASTSDTAFIKQIPFAGIIQYLSSTRSKLQSSGMYAQQQMENVKEQLKSSTYLASLKTSHEWQFDLFRLHALVLLSNQEASLQNMLASHSTTYKINIKQIDFLLSQWLKPYKPQTVLANEANGQKSDDKKYTDKPIMIFEKYFIEVFYKTQCYHQPKLLNVILKNPVFENYILHWQTHSKQNFFVYFFTILLGLGDRAKKQEYLAKYPLNKIFPKDIRANRIFYSYMNDAVPLFSSLQQFEMLLDCLDRLNLSNQYKDTLLKVFNQQQLHRYASYEIAFRQKEEPTKMSNRQSSKPKSKASSKSLDKVQNQKERALDLNTIATYDNIVSETRETSEFYFKVHSKIIDSLIKDYESPVSFLNTLSRRFAVLVSYIQFLCKQNTINIDSDLKQIAQKVNGLLLNKKIEDQFEYAHSVFKLYALGLLDQQKVSLHLLKTTAFKHKSIFKLLCLSILGKQKAIMNKLTTQSQWNQYQNQSYKVSSQTKDSLMWLIISIRMSSAPRFNGLLKRLNNICDPVQRKLIFNELKKFQQKHQLLNYELKFQQLFFQQNIETAAEKQAQRQVTISQNSNNIGHENQRHLPDESYHIQTINNNSNNHQNEQTGEKVVNKVSKSPLFQNIKFENLVRKTKSTK